MKKYYLKKLDNKKLKEILKRKSIKFKRVFPIVKKIIRDVKENGDEAIRYYTEKFDGIKLDSFEVNEKEIDFAIKRIPKDVKLAFKKAAENIEKFQKIQMIKKKKVETMPGVNCFLETRPIEKVGLYIPAGKAPLASTVLMLGIPAKLAGCKEIVLLTPPDKDGKVSDIILFSAKLSGIRKIFKIGGAQAIAGLAYGTETVPKVDKIFGPGNQYVTAAKMLVSIDPEGAAIDMPAGPTELLIIAADYTRADFVASDILSQAEHGEDSQIILLTTSDKKADEISLEIKRQIKNLPRKEIAQKALNNGFILISKSIEKAIAFSNMFAPEHLILNTKDAERYVSKIINAGSVFLGPYSCESAGDYASGTNHVLPTSGYAKIYSGISVNDFQKKVSFQKITAKGAKNLGPIVAKMAEEELLEGHKMAMELRYK